MLDNKFCGCWIWICVPTLRVKLYFMGLTISSTLISDSYILPGYPLTAQREGEWTCSNNYLVLTARCIVRCVCDCSLHHVLKTENPRWRPSFFTASFLSRRRRFSVVLVSDCVAKPAKWSNSGRVNYCWHIGGEGESSSSSSRLPSSFTHCGRKSLTEKEKSLMHG